MPSYIYIAGLGHSGSTILDMSLGAIPGITGLGELKTILDDSTRERHYASTCSCGKIATKCPVWKDLPGVLENKNSINDKLEAAIQHARNILGEDVILVDTSKNSYRYLEYLDRNHDLEVIYLTRDIRSWSYSRAISTKRSVLYYILRWWAENRKLLTALKRMGIKPHFFGYEEIALYPEHLLKLLTEKTGLPYSYEMLIPGKTSSHIISGNVARVDDEKRKAWVYDARWLLSRRILFWSPLLIFFRSMNSKLVYSNIRGKGRKDFYLFSNTKKEALNKSFN